MFARHSAIYLFGRVMTGALGLIVIAIFTRVLDPSDYGRYSLFVAGAGLIAAVVFQWLRQGVVRFSSADGIASPNLLATILASFIVLIPATASVAALAWGFSPRNTLWAKALAMVCIFAWAQAWFELNLDIARSRLAPIRYSLSSGLRAALTLGLGVLGAVVGGVYGLLGGVAASYVFSSMVPAFGAWKGVFRAGRFDAIELRRLARFGLPLSATFVLVFVIDSSDRFFLAWFLGNTEVGIYSAAYNLAQYSIGSLLVAVNLAGYPLVVRRFEAEGEANTVPDMSRYLSLLTFIGIPATVGLVLLARPVGILILGNYVPSVSGIIVEIVAVATLLAGIKSYYIDIVFMLKQHTGWQLLTAAVAATTNLGLNWIMIPRWGARGAAYSTLAAFGVAFLLSVLIARKYFPLPLITKDLLKAILAAGGMAGLLLIWRPTASWASVLSAIGSGGLLYGLLLWLLKPGYLPSVFRRSR